MPVPDWAHDLNAAWNDLLPDLLAGGGTLKITSFPPTIGIFGLIAQTGGVLGKDHMSAQDTAAMICEAWLAWHAAKEVE